MKGRKPITTEHKIARIKRKYRGIKKFAKRTREDIIKTEIEKVKKSNFTKKGAV